MATEPGPEPRWLPVAEAARALGVTEHAIRRRIRRGTLETRREQVGNHVRTLVAIPGEEQGTGQSREPGTEHLASLREHVARLEEQLAAAELRAVERARFEEEAKAELRRQVDQARADLERERQRAEASERRLDDVLRELREERRRPWPGLRRWWRRVWEGEG